VLLSAHLTGKVFFRLRPSMADSAANEITELLQVWRQGDEHALEKLTPQIYRELHRAAKRCMKGERDGHSMQTKTGFLRAERNVDGRSRATIGIRPINRRMTC
jgi:hypothetical protein